MSILFSYPKSCTRPVKLSIQRQQENDHLEVDLLRMIKGNVGNYGNWDMRIHRFKMMLHSIQSLAGPSKIRPSKMSHYFNVTEAAAVAQ
jgi:hypothetical protein